MKSGPKTKDIVGQPTVPMGHRGAYKRSVEELMHPIASWIRRQLPLAFAYATLAPLTALAQQPAPETPPAIEEVVITGSRIASPNAQSASPIQVVSSKEILATGKNDITDI